LNGYNSEFTHNNTTDIKYKLNLRYSKSLNTINLNTTKPDSILNYSNYNEILNFRSVNAFKFFEREMFLKRHKK
jgi:hypothetical protein